MEEEGFGRRVTGLMVAFLLVSALWAARLGWLQLVQGRSLTAIATKYHSRTIYYRWGHGSEGRGAILDRQLRPFTEAKLQPGLAVFTSTGQSSGDYGYWLQTLADFSGYSQEDIVLASQQGRPLALDRSLPTSWELPHWIVPVSGDWDSEGNFRRYTYGKDFACHVLGEAGSPYQGEQGKRVGRSGIECQFDQLLRCQRPGVSAITDALDELIPGLGYRELVEPDRLPNVVLSLDIKIQGLVERVLDAGIAAGRIPPYGAVVVMDPENGDILAMCSRPPIQGAENQQNRATRKSPNVNLQPLASMVKVVTAAAALEKNPQLINARFSCAGTLTLGANTFECAHGPHGEEDMAAAMANSCNLYFAQLAAEVGGKELLAMAKAMGLGRKFNIGLPAWEVEAGHLPELKDLATSAGLANNFAMGGNKIEATPLQAAVMLSAIANGGWRVEPRLVLAVNQDLEAPLKSPPRSREKIMSSSTANAVAGLLRNVVVQGKTVTFDAGAYPYAAAQLAAKTGTSDPLPPANYHLRWCGGFFPWRDPEYVIVYLAEVPPGWTRVDRGGIVAEIAEGLAALSGK